MQTKICPDCGDDINASARSHKCGWREAGQAKAKKAYDPMHGICEHTRDGQRCAQVGTISPTTLGSGPWYCRQHYDETQGRTAGKSGPPRQGFAAIKSILGKVAPAMERQPGEDDA